MAVIAVLAANSSLLAITNWQIYHQAEILIRYQPKFNQDHLLVDGKKKNAPKAFSHRQEDASLINSTALRI